MSSSVEYTNIPYRILYWERHLKEQYEPYMRYVPPYIQRIVPPSIAERLGKLVGLVLESEKRLLVSELLKAGRETTRSITSSVYSFLRSIEENVSKRLKEERKHILKYYAELTRALTYELEKNLTEYGQKLINYLSVVYSREVAEHVARNVQHWINNVLLPYCEKVTQEIEKSMAKSVTEYAGKLGQTVTKSLIQNITKQVLHYASILYARLVQEMKAELGEEAYKYAKILVDYYTKKIGQIIAQVAKEGRKEVENVLNYAKMLMNEILNN